MEYWAIFNIAFFASLSHCIGMCGGIVFALNAKLRQLKINIVLANLLYNFGRLSAYGMIGILCGGMGVIFEFSAQAKSLFQLFIGMAVSIMALLMWIAPKILNILEPSTHQNRLLKAMFAVLYRNLNYRNIFFIGLANGFLPCGIVYYFALIALSSRGALEGMTVMIVFGLCTIIPMCLTGMLSAILLYRSWLYRLSLFLMLLFGLYTIFKALKGL